MRFLNERKVKFNKQVNFKLILSWILALTAFIEMRPYFVWDTYKSGAFTPFIQIFQLISVALIIIYFCTNLQKIKHSTLIIVASLIILQLYMLITGKDNYSYLSIGNYIVLVILFGFLLLTEQERKDIFNKFTLIYAISLVLGIVFWILINLHIPLSYEYLPTDHIGKLAIGAYYKKYFGSAFLITPSTTYMRLSAIYDEPGVVGTFSALFLIADNFQLKKKLRNIIILIGGILSFSLAFYLIIIIGIAIRAFMKGSFKFALLLVAILIVFKGIMSIDTDNIIINDVFQKRLQLINGTLTGDNRTNVIFDKEYDEFLNSDLTSILFGNGKGKSTQNIALMNGSSYKMLIYDFGFIGFVGLLLWFIYASKKMAGFDKKCLMLLLVFLVSIYQRPYVFNIPYIFLLFGGFANLKCKEDVIENMEQILPNFEPEN